MCRCIKQFVSSHSDTRPIVGEMGFLQLYNTVRLPFRAVLQVPGVGQALTNRQSIVHRQQHSGGLTKSTSKELGMPLGERIKENTKTASYTGVILLGVGLTGGLFYVIFRELFSSNSPQNIYSAALDRCVNDTRIQDALGAPIKGFGEENSRRRRRHVSHTLYELEGTKHIRMNFYIQGIRNKATVFLEKKAVSILF